MSELKLIEFAKDQCEIFPEDSTMGMFLREVIKTLEVKAIPIDKIKKTREEIVDRVYRYSGSGNEVTQAYCDGFKASLEILDKLIESEE